MASRLLSRYPFILSAKQSVATLLTRSFSYSTTTAPASSSYLALGQFSFLSRFRPLAAVAAGYVHTSPPIVGESRAFSTRQTQSSLNDSSPNWSNRPPKETILLDGCDFEHWLVVMEKPDESMTRDDIINWYIQTLSAVVGSEEEARMKIYSVSTKHYFAFGALVSEELSYKLKELPKVRWVLPDSYLDVKNKDYGGEPFINGQAVPYDPKYHEEWVRNNQKAMERNRRNDRPRNSDRSRNFERRRQNMQYQGPPMPNQGPPMPNQGPPPLQHQGPPPMPNQGPPPMPNQGPPPMQHQGPPPMPNQGPPPMQHQGPPPMPNQGPPPMQNQGPPMYNQRPPMQNQGPPMQNPATNMGTPAPGMGGPGPQNNMGGLNMGGPAQYSRTTPNNIGGPPNAGWGSSAPNNNMGNNFQNSGGMQHQNSPPLGPGPNYQPYPSNMGGPPAGDPYQQRDMPGRDMPPPPPPNYR